MNRFRRAVTAFKITVMNVSIIALCIVIGFAQWNEAAKNSSFGSGGYSQGFVTTVFFAVILAGIPMILAALVAHFILARLLFRPGELDEFRAHQLLTAMRTPTDPPSIANKDTPTKVFED